jgi:hypothetical protein
MSYSAADLIDDLTLTADLLGVTLTDPTNLAALDLGPNPTNTKPTRYWRCASRAP